MPPPEEAHHGHLLREGGAYHHPGVRAQRRRQRAGWLVEAHDGRPHQQTSPISYTIMLKRILAG